MPTLPKTARLPLAALLLLTASSMALSQKPAPTPPAPPTTPAQPVISDDSVDDFSDLNRNLANLREKIGKVRDVVAKNEDPNVPANQREQFQHSVAQLLASFADDGEVAKLGKAAVDFVNKRLADAEQDTNFPPDQRTALATRWRRIATQTETAVASLETTRKELAEKLKLLQSKADFVDQMEKLKQARAVLDAIGDLSDQRQTVTGRIRDLLQGKPSGDTGDDPNM
jgi:lysyl-tRNA synthetase class I